MKDRGEPVLSLIGYSTQDRDTRIELKRLRISKGHYQQCGGGRRVIRKKIKGE